MPVEHLPTLSSLHAAISSHPIVIVDFYGPQCPPCEEIAPMYEEWSSREDFGSVKFCKMDIIAVPEVMDEQDIDSMPTFRVYVGGDRKCKGEVVGARWPEQVTEMIEKALKEGEGGKMDRVVIEID